MSLQSANPQAAPTPQMVANAFVEQYYHILHHSPELVYRFYQDSSVLSRPNHDGAMSSVTTMQGINEKILSMDFTSYKAEIKTADAQNSYKDGVTVLVTGCLTGKDNLQRKFAQSFFLAPQDVGYFVLNDVFRYLDDDEPSDKYPIESINNANQVSPVPEPVTRPDPKPLESDRVIPVAEDNNAKANAVAVREVQIADGKENKKEPQNSIDESDSSLVKEDAPKKSYASIVKVAKGSEMPTKIDMPTNTSKASTKKAENEPVGSSVHSPAPEGSTQESVVSPETGEADGEAEGYSIYIRNLPFNTTVSQLDAEFKKFGPIKKDGIQVRNNKQQGYCFGFVEFLSQSSMNDAIQASPINILGRNAVIEAKRTAARGDGERGGYSFPRGGYRSDSFRGRGSHRGGRGYGYGSWGSDPCGRGRGSFRGGRGRIPSGPRQNVG
ncbi:PREDICTED: ras GTPase-activating protein-binding protein 2-like [Tarenaya hassleriana]|uniref:ras GTPase-activating protein-binding protein 2-like n=1 Tax=Tarenaya hassleriana TaxID=28532 RepID=UPI00053C8AEF|nr:PREDICTED: ras GTPase-activating protein-binding protein 2-like [Tarenaya hassleriana]XP_010528412.1 PREDICTED: ras GTPase-activating protein-binding protein 2-like [Tarenaya hassleriana]